MNPGIPQPPPKKNILDNIGPQFQSLEQNHKLYRIYYPYRRDGERRSPIDFEYKFKNHRFDHHHYVKTNSDSNLFETTSSDLGVYYASPVLNTTEQEEKIAISCCLAECYGDSRIISDIKTRKICSVQPLSPLKLLDLRGIAAMQAGTQAEIVSDCVRETTQMWSRFFYRNTQIYSLIDGLIYTSRRNGIDAVVLYERAKDRLKIETDNTMSDYHVRPVIEEIARKLLITISL